MGGLGIGGAEIQLLLLLRHLPPDRFVHEVCHISPRADLAGNISELGVAVTDLSSGGRRALSVAAVRLLRLVVRFRPNLLHTDGFFANLYGRLVGRLFGIPVLTTVGNTLILPREVAALGPAATRRSRMLRAVNAVTGRLWTTHFMAITHAVKDTVEQEYRVPGDRVSVVSRGVDLRTMVPASATEIAALRHSLVPPRAWPVLLNVGRLTRQKGQEYLIRALPRIRAAFPHTVALLVGEGELERSLRTLAQERGVAGAVCFLGRRADVLRLLQAADLFVFPSLFEGTGVALLEAMAMAKPIVASSIPAIEEVAGDAAVLVPVGDADRLADAIVDLAARTDRWPALGIRARRRAEDRFDIAASVRAFGALCEGVALGANSAHASAPGPVGSCR
jgi:glycosyltransferase involved in cell wall biosynthesis